jgi:hypothetical protein
VSSNFRITTCWTRCTSYTRERCRNQKRFRSSWCCAGWTISSRTTAKCTSRVAKSAETCRVVVEITSWACRIADIRKVVETRCTSSAVVNTNGATRTRSITSSTDMSSNFRITTCWTRCTSYTRERCRNQKRFRSSWCCAGWTISSRTTAKCTSRVAKSAETCRVVVEITSWACRIADIRKIV